MHERAKGKPFKFYLSITTVFHKPTDPGVFTDPAPTFNSEPVAIFPTTNLEEYAEILFQNLMHQRVNFQGEGSGWVLFSLVSIDINVFGIDLLKASSYIKSPECIKAHEACINIKNTEDNKCFIRNYINNLCTPNAQPAVVTGEVINEESPTVPEIVQPSTSLGKRKSSTNPKRTINKERGVNISAMRRRFPMRIVETRKKKRKRMMMIESSLIPERSFIIELITN